MAVAELAVPQPGERVLDLAAAPGGKSTHMAALMGNSGLLVVNEIQPKRAHSLANNIERWGARNAVVLNETPQRLVDHFGAYFDKVLVDAPCSGEGMFRKEPGMRNEWSIDAVEQYAILQMEILESAKNLIRPGGKLIYSTCTFAPRENETLIARFLDANPEFELETPAWYPGFHPGRQDWVADGLPGSGMHQTVRIWPHSSVGEGHFIAVLRKHEQIQGDRIENSQKYPLRELEAVHRQDIHSFWQENMAMEEIHHLSVEGNHLYAVLPDLPDLTGLNVIHWGWWLGVMKKKRLDPSHAFAMGIRSDDVLRTYPLSGDDPKATAFLRGEVLRFPGPDGWLMVTIDGYPLGWGKRVKNRIKSHVPNWLRFL